MQAKPSDFALSNQPLYPFSRPHSGDNVGNLSRSLEASPELVTSAVRANLTCCSDKALSARRTLF